MSFSSRTAAALLILLALSFSSFLHAGTVKGKVTSGKNETPAVSVQVIVDGTALSAVTDADGAYEIAGVPTGTHNIIFGAIGYGTDTISVEVPAEGTVSADAAIELEIAQLPKMKISGRLQGQTKAYNIQMNADNIKNIISSDYVDRFPDQNSAEALQRVSGISVQRDQGEGRYVQIRGSKPNYTGVSVNGVSIPAPEGEVRSVALDVIPADVLSQIEVSKAVTPEMDGGAIGGMVNLQTRKAVSEKPKLQASAALGYNALNGQRENGIAPLNGQGSLSVGKRFGEEGKIGLLIGGSYLRANRGSDNSEYSWSIDRDDKDVTFEFLEELELRDYTVIRDRLGLNATFDANVSENVNIYLSGLYNRFGDQEYRRRTTLVFLDDNEEEEIETNYFRYVPAEVIEDGDTSMEYSKLERELKDRYEVQDILSVNLGSEMNLGLLKVHPQVAFSLGQETEPDAFYSIFETEVDTMTADWREDLRMPKFTSSTDIDEASAYELDGVESEDNVTRETNLQGSLDLTLPLTAGSGQLEIKGGIKGRQRTKMRDNEYKEYGWDGDDDVTLDMVEGDYTNPEFLNGEYPHSARNFQDPEKIKDHFDDNESDYELSDPIDLLEDSYAGDYDATENVGAGYLQAKLSAGIFSTLAGLRIEYTGAHYDANLVDLERAVEIDEDGGDVTDAVKEVTGYKNTIEFMPMVHFKLSPLDNMNIRLAYTRTFARPDFWEFAPYRVQNDDGDEVELGNPDLENTQAHNIDVMAEYYFKSLGMVSAGFFMKSIDNFIYSKVWIGGDGKEYTQPVNGDNGTLFGLELVLEKQFTFLPSFLNGFGVGANYTFASSEAEIDVQYETEDVDGEDSVYSETRTVRLPGQSEHILNAYLQYEKYGISARLAFNFNGEFIDEYGTVEEEDAIYGNHLQLDLSLAYTPPKLNKLNIFADFNNLTNEPLYYYANVDGEEVPLQQEYYSWWCSFGVKLTF